MNGAPDYIITARIVAEDAAIPGTAAVEKRLDGLERRAKGFGDILGGSLFKAFALIGGTAGLGAAVKGMIGLNSEIDQANRGMATLYSGLTGRNITDSLGMARGAVAGLRKDAAGGVGELKDYLTAFQGVLAPGLGAGKTTDQMRELVRNGLTVGFAIRGEEGLANMTSELEHALGRGAGTQTTPIVIQALKAIGVSEHAFNAESTAKRFDTLNKAFGKFGGGVDLMGKSWAAQFDTLKDNARFLITEVSRPLFDRWSADLIKVNDWLARNKDHLVEIAQVWGAKLLALWEKILANAKEYAVVTGAVGIAKAAAPLVTTGIGALGAEGGAGAGLLGLLGGPEALAAGAAVAVVAGSIYSMYVAATSYPDALSALTMALGDTQASAWQLWAAVQPLGPPLKDLVGLFGYGMLGAAFDLVGALDIGVKAVDTIAVAIEQMAGKIGTVLAMLYSPKGFAGLDAVAAAMRGEDAVGAAKLRQIWSFGPVPGGGGGLGDLSRFNSAAHGGGRNVSKLPDNYFTGPITVTAHVERADDPDRVADAMAKAFNHRDMNRVSARRPARPPGRG